MDLIMFTTTSSFGVGNNISIANDISDSCFAAATNVHQSPESGVQSR